MQILIFIVFILKHNLSQGNRTFFFKLAASNKGKRANSGGLRDWRGRPFKDRHGAGRKDGRVWAAHTHTHGHVLSPTGRVFQKHWPAL